MFCMQTMHTRTKHCPVNFPRERDDMHMTKFGICFHYTLILAAAERIISLIYKFNQLTFFSCERQFFGLILGTTCIYSLYNDQRLQELKLHCKLESVRVCYMREPNMAYLHGWILCVRQNFGNLQLYIVSVKPSVYVKINFA